MRIIGGFILSFLLLVAPLAAQSQKANDSTQSKASADTTEKKTKWEDRKSDKVSPDNSVAKVGKDTGELASKGAVETGRAATRGAKWLAKPWSKDKSSSTKDKTTKQK